MDKREVIDLLKGCVMKVRVLSSTSPEDLEDTINDFLANCHETTIVDIKFSTFPSEGQHLREAEYSALIIYKEIQK
jgi:hypothetical protein